MKTLWPALTLLLALPVSTSAAGSVGFQRAAVPDAGGTPREVGIWYPSDAPASAQPLGPYRHAVAVDGAITGSRLPVIVMLHGVQGSFENHYDTALALAEAGFVVAGVNQPQSMRLPERSRHVGRVLDYLLGSWVLHDRLDPSRVGLFGFSIGGFTALVALGGVPDLGRMPSYCAEHRDRVCGMAIDTSVPSSAWAADRRVRAAVVAAPTLGFTFGPGAFAQVAAPVQLWRAGRDEITPHPGHAEAVYQALPTRPEYTVVPEAGHFVFIACSADMASRSPAICGDAPGFDRTAFHRDFNSAVVTFFRKRLSAP